MTSADTQVDLDAAGEDSAASMLACGTVSVGAAEGALVAAGGKEEVRTYRIPTGHLWLMLCFVVRWGSMCAVRGDQVWACSLFWGTALEDNL